jgi:diguanylate cyclase (GGDEF)-like protein
MGLRIKLLLVWFVLLLAPLAIIGGIGYAYIGGQLGEGALDYRVLFATLGLTLLLSGVVFNLIVNNLAIKPIQKLIQATGQVAKGDLKPELDIRSQDELGQLAVAFRQMSAQLLHTSRRIRQLAYFDPLTQLPNRTTLRETLSRLLTRSERDKCKTAVLFIDLDDFKKVNDRLGHEAGDELLVQISHRLKNRLRQADILFEQAGVASVEQLISRRGGDEFNAILTRIKAPHDAAVVAERIIQDLNEPFFVNQSEIHVGASVGVALFPDDGADADTLLRNADLAMYEAKAKGKNNYHIFTSAINEQVHQRLALENSLQMAVVHSQLLLYYQPKLSLVDMSPVGFEALVRWKHPEKGIILPGKFIPVAEESNLIREIGNWVLAESMRQLRLWDDMLPKHLRIAINISARQLVQNDLVEQFWTMMERFSIPSRRLAVELTETSVLQDESMAIQHLSELRMLGVEISLDDFGTGYSSLSFLRKLPIDTVKIDRGFTAKVIQNSEARAIVISLLNLCKHLNVRTIAEGIETADQLQFMLEHGCDQGQGYLFSKPLPSDKVMAFLAEPSYLAMS